MDWKVLLTIFGAVFIAELSDKTQLATVLFAADREVSKIAVFVGAFAALICSSALGVAAGAAISEYASPRILQIVAGAGFIAIGVWTPMRA